MLKAAFSLSVFSGGWLALVAMGGIASMAQASTVSPAIDISGGADIPVVGGSNVTVGIHLRCCLILGDLRSRCLRCRRERIDQLS